ncbi:MAG: biotin--[Clostridia bacterium]|nr:biotin--[acetyl-CoA-carboxylase] ligase [Clostridia bacterium]
MLSEKRIIEELNNLGIKAPKIVYYDLTDSTNTRAREYAKANPTQKSPVIFIADGQTAGRGRRGRSFVSESGAGIYISILTYPAENNLDVAGATAKAAVSLSRAIESLCDADIKIKWVNDLYLGGKKLAGILCEGEFDSEGKMTCQVVGMGINIYKNGIIDEISTIATSIENELGNAPDRAKLVARIIKEFLAEGGDYYTEYKARSFTIGKRVTVMKLKESYEATVLDINPDFSLSIERDGKVEWLFTGEISLKI